MNKTDARYTPTEPGWYCCWLYLSNRPVVLYWGEQTKEWRSGAAKQNVTHWMGPLPK